MDHTSSDYARVFVRFKAPDNFRNKILEVQEELKQIDPSQEYNEPGDLHISVASFVFMKQRSEFSRYENLVARLSQVTSEFSPFQINIRGLYSFPTVIYSRVQDQPAESLQSVKRRVDEELKREQFVEPIVVGTSYIPHLTIATFKTNDVAALLHTIESDPFKSYDFGTGTIEELEIKELNMSDISNRTLAGRFASFRNRFANTDRASQRQNDKTTLTLTRKRS